MLRLLPRFRLSRTPTKDWPPSVGKRDTKPVATWHIEG
jgi:hypothetical protein